MSTIARGCSEVSDHLKIRPLEYHLRPLFSINYELVSSVSKPSRSKRPARMILSSRPKQSGSSMSLNRSDFLINCKEGSMAFGTADDVSTKIGHMTLWVI